MTALRPTDLRVRLLDALLLQPPVRRADLCDVLDVSLPVLAREVNVLRAAGLVVQSAEDPARRALGTRGRPPVYVSLVARAAFAVGIEIGRARRTSSSATSTERSWRSGHSHGSQSIRA